jgi:hypothetical protein
MSFGLMARSFVAACGNDLAIPRRPRMARSFGSQAIPPPPPARPPPAPSAPALLLLPLAPAGRQGFRKTMFNQRCALGPVADAHGGGHAAWQGANGKRENSDRAQARRNRTPRCGHAAHSGWRDPCRSREMSPCFLTTGPPFWGLGGKFSKCPEHRYQRWKSTFYVIRIRTRALCT